MTSASLRDRSFETPNAATWIARTLVEQGEFANGGLRAYHLPAEPLYLATGFAILPESLWRYLHIPVVVLFVTAIATVGLAIGGPSVALAAGLAAGLDPYVVSHGPVWDDTFFAAALEWCIFAILITLAANRGKLASSEKATLVLVAFVAALAALSRTHSQLVLVSVAVVACMRPRLRPLRQAGCAILVGVVIALAAWGVRNSVVLGSFYVGSTRDGKALFESNCAYTRQGIRELGVVGGFMHACSEAQVAHALSLGELESDRQLRRYALAYITSNPLDVAKTAAFKVLVSLSGFDFSSPPFSTRNVVAVGSRLVILLLGPVGLWQIRRRISPSLTRDMVVLITAVTVGYTLLLLAIGPTGLRYRISLDGFLFLGVATVIVDTISSARRHLLFARTLHAIGG